MNKLTYLYTFVATSLVPGLAFALGDTNCHVKTRQVANSVPELDPGSAMAAFTLLAAAAFYMHRKSQTRA